jgi:hypothetical protein
MLGALSNRSALSVLVGALFKKSGLFLNMPSTSNTVDMTDVMLLNNSDDDGIVSIECKEDESTNYEDGDSDTDC